MKPDLKKLLERIFLGEVPPSLSFIENESSIEAFKRQGIEYDANGKFPESIIKLNYVLFIQDIVEIQKEKGIKASQFTKPEEFRRDMGILFRSGYLEFIQDHKRDNFEKLLFTHFIRRFLSTYQTIYHIDIMNDQAYFLDELGSMEDYFGQEIKTEQDRLESQLIQAQRPFHLSPEWPYDIEKLFELSKDLFQEGFTNADNAFVAAFDSNFNGKCNWIKDRTKLLFLLWLLLDKGATDKPSDLVIDVCCKRFLIKGNDTIKKVAQSTNILKQIDGDRSNLKGEFLILQNLYQDLGFQ